MKIKTLKFNFVMNMILTVSNFLFPLITFPYVSRVLNPIGTGKVAFAYSIVSYFTIFAAFGVANYGIRACAQVRDNKDKLSKTVQEIMAINVVLMICIYIIYFLGINYIPELKAEKDLFLISGLNILFTIIGVEWLYKGVEQYFYITIRSIIFKAIAFVLIFVYVKSPDDYTMYAFIIIFATVGSGVVNLFNLKKIIYLKKYKNYSFIKHIKPMTTFFIITIAVAFYVYVNVAMLGFIKGNQEVGYYNAAYRIKDVMVSIITALGAVLLPRLSYYVENGMHDEFNNIIRKSMRFIFISSLPLVIFCILFARDAVLILAGPAYTNSIVPLQILSIIIFVVGVSNLTGIQMLIPLRKEKYLCYSVVIAALISISINFALMPKLGAVGTAISVVVAELSILSFQVFVLRKYFKILFGDLNIIKVTIALLIASALSFCLHFLPNLDDFLSFIIRASAFFICYLMVLLIMKESFTTSTLKTISAKLFRS